MEKNICSMKTGRKIISQTHCQQLRQSFLCTVSFSCAILLTVCGKKTEQKTGKNGEWRCLRDESVMRKQIVLFFVIWRRRLNGFSFNFFSLFFPHLLSSSRELRTHLLFMTRFLSNFSLFIFVSFLFTCYDKEKVAELPLCAVHKKRKKGN